MKVTFLLYVVLSGMIGVIFENSNQAFPLNNYKLGRVLGTLIVEGNKMMKLILKGNGEVVPRRSPRPLQL